MNKQEIRAYIRQKKRAMSPEQMEEKSARLTRLFLQSEQYRAARSIYGYIPVNQEVRIGGILEQALRDGKRVAVPKCYGRHMRFIWLEGECPLERHPLGFLQPVADGPVADDETALVLMPGVAFDRFGRRIGYGGGFYDRFLAWERRHPTLALCYDFQVFDTLETEEFDIPVDVCLWA